MGRPAGGAVAGRTRRDAAAAHPPHGPHRAGRGTDRDPRGRAGGPRAELRRIERDLHDGTQAQLVAAALRLGLADRRFDADPDAARALFLEAREGLEEALTQLRSVVRGIYPPILSDRGLGGALRALAGGQPIPIEMDVSAADAAAPAAVEAAAYFVVAEALERRQAQRRPARPRHRPPRRGPDGDLRAG
ncbi:sensor histidine kinase [Actinomadura sp. CNU-125]|uniref:sensor histidine kinase n=1 Tax=Actinomadura sp. CNU-125 TaxID=1904961 RepID=UPI00396768E8